MVRAEIAEVHDPVVNELSSWRDEVAISDDGSRRIEDWIVRTIDERGSASSQDDWEDLIGRITPKRRTSGNRAKLAGPAGAAAGWSRFRVIRRRGITVVALTDRALIKEQELGELAEDLLALIEAGHNRVVLNFSAVERLSSWAVGAVAEALRRCNAVRHGALKICGLREDVAAIFTITGLVRQVAIFDDETSAIDSPWPELPELLPLPVAVLSALTRSTQISPGDTVADEDAGPVTDLKLFMGDKLPSEGHPAMDRIWLIPQCGPSKGRPIVVEGPSFVIGRDATCKLRPGSSSVSRFHAAIEHRDGGLFLRDLGSTNGTLLNGRLLRSEDAEIHKGDRIQVGPLAFVFALSTGGAESASIEELVSGWVRSRTQEEDGQESDSPATTDFPIPQGLEGEPFSKHEVIEDVLVLTPLVSALDAESSVGALRGELVALYDRPLPRRVVVNLTHVGHLSGKAIGALLAHHLKLDQAGGALRVCQAHARVAAALEQVQLAMLVECYATLDDAVLSSWPSSSSSASSSAV
jgi:anti-anti-sigma factor